MIIVLDLETTGLKSFDDHIIEIAMLKFDENTFEIIESYNSFVDPEIPIPEIISNITGIFENDIKWAPKIKEIKEKIKDFIWENPILGHNVQFDIDFLLAKWIDVENNIKLDTFFLANFLNFQLNSLNLEMLCKYYKIPFPGMAHRAKFDVEATIILFQKELEYFSNLSIDEKNLVQYIFSISNDKNIQFLQDLLFPMFKANSKVEFKDFASTILNEIWKKRNTKKFFVDENLKCEDYENIFENILSSKIKKKSSMKVERRENQIEMTKKVYSAFKHWKKVAIEAPTWLWKSFAYLIPSIIYSVQNGEKVYVTTKTKTLQDQLYFKDLAFLSENLGVSFSYSKLKWKKNYISLKRFFDRVLIENLSYEEVWFFIKLSFWLLETEFGELEELNLYSKEFSLSKELNSEWINFWKQENKKSEKNNFQEQVKKVNPYETREFLEKAKDALDNSNIIVINHSLLFADLALDIPNLTNLDNIVIDEAHNIEDTVTDSLKEDYSLKNLKEFFEWLEKIFQWKNFWQVQFLKTKNQLLWYLDILENYSYSYLLNDIKESTSYKTILVRNNYFIGIDTENYLKNIVWYILDIINILKNIKEYDFEKEIYFLKNTSKNLEVFLDKTNSNKFIKMISANENMNTTLSYTLLNPWSYLREKLWNKLDSCVLTSATLSTSGNFNYIQNILDLTNFKFYSFESDFDYKTQACLFIPTDIWNIKDNIDEIVNFLKEFFVTVSWNTLVLLTSFVVIKKIYTNCNIPLKNAWINLYAQSIWWSKMKQLSQFKENPNNSILLWTDSFWEWIDIPGEDLKYLVIHKFPFAVPSDPIFQARKVFFKDSFREYSIPKAIIKLKQWFWRLIRTKTDKWVVILLDDRINSDWGVNFYEAFPKDINIKKGTRKQFLEVLTYKNKTLH